MKKFATNVTCPMCGAPFINDVHVEEEQLTNPTTRCKIAPSSTIFVYRVTSDDIKAFITDKVKCLCPGVKVEVAPMYIERKSRNSSTKKISYSSVKIAFSSNAVAHNDAYGYYGKLGEAGDSIRLIPTMFHSIYQKYQIREADINHWLGSYKAMEELEESLGISEDYLRELKKSIKPSRFPDATGVDWIFFAASVERIIQDMFDDPDRDPADSTPTHITIQEVYPVSKENVEFLVYLHVGDVQDSPEDPRVRQLLLNPGRKK